MASVGLVAVSAEQVIPPRQVEGDLTAGTRKFLANVVYAAQTSAGAFSVSIVDVDLG